MFQCDDLFADFLVQWVNSASEKQLRFITFGLLVSIRRCKEQLPDTQENFDALNCLAYGLKLAVAAKENCDSTSPLDVWSTKYTSLDAILSFLDKFGFADEYPYNQ